MKNLKSELNRIRTAGTRPPASPAKSRRDRRLEAREARRKLKRAEPVTHLRSPDTERAIAA